MTLINLPTGDFLSKGIPKWFIPTFPTYRTSKINTLLINHDGTSLAVKGAEPRSHLTHDFLFGMTLTSPSGHEVMCTA